MKGIKNRGSQTHRVRTDYTRMFKHKGLACDRNMCDNDDGETNDDEPEPDDAEHNEE